MVLSVVASPDEDSDPVSEGEGCLLGAVGSAEQQDQR